MKVQGTLRDVTRSGSERLSEQIPASRRSSKILQVQSFRIFLPYGNGRYCTWSAAGASVLGGVTTKRSPAASRVTTHQASVRDMPQPTGFFDATANESR